MRITIVGAAYPFRGGIAHHAALLYRALAARHDVRIVTFTRQYPAFLFPGKTQNEEGDTESFRVPSEAMVDSVNPLSWIRAGRRIRAHRPDLLLLNYSLPFFGPCFGTIARIVRRGGNTRVVYLCHNVIPHEPRPGDRAFARFAFGAADAFVVQAHAVERELLDFLPGARTVYVPHPEYHGFGDAVPSAEARQRLRLGTGHVLLFFGYVRRYKGLHVLLDAMAIVRRTLDVQLLVVGEFYDDETPYREQIRRLALEHAVTIWSGYIPSNEVKYFFCGADAAVLPYTSATQSGIAQIAYHFDLPVIATDVGGLAEVVRDGDTGIVVAPGDAALLAAGIIRYFTACDREKMRRAVAEEKKQYSWDRLVAALEELMR